MPGGQRRPPGGVAFRLLAPAMLVALGLGAAAAQDLGKPRARLDDDVFVDAGAGFRIGKPSGWFFLPVRTIVAQANRAAGRPPPAPGIDLVKTLGWSVIVSRSPALGREAGAAVTVFATHDWAGGTVLADEASSRACRALASPYGDAEVAGPVREAAVEQQPAIRMDLRGRADDQEIRATLLCVARDRRAYVVVAAAPADAFEGAAAAFESILAGFRLD